MEITFKYILGIFCCLNRSSWGKIDWNHGKHITIIINLRGFYFYYCINHIVIFNVLKVNAVETYIIQFFIDFIYVSNQWDTNKIEMNIQIHIRCKILLLYTAIFLLLEIENRSEIYIFGDISQRISKFNNFCIAIMLSGRLDFYFFVYICI